jgi:hypothetical protein
MKRKTNLRIVALILDLKLLLFERKAVFPPTPPRLSELCVEAMNFNQGSSYFRDYLLRNGSPIDSPVLSPSYCERRIKSNNDVEETRSLTS